MDDTCGLIVILGVVMKNAYQILPENEKHWKIIVYANGLKYYYSVKAGTKEEVKNLYLKGSRLVKLIGYIKCAIV